MTAVNVLTHVFRDVASSGAARRINGDDRNAMFSSARLVGILNEPVFATQGLKVGEVCGGSKYDKMPMYCAVVMRLSDSEAVYA